MSFESYKGVVDKSEQLGIMISHIVLVKKNNGHNERPISVLRQILVRLVLF